ncbi:MAG: DegT/DnrJ/EryC1/StrS aminotransferase family protein [Leptospirales bacterium]
MEAYTNGNLNEYNGHVGQKKFGKEGIVFYKPTLSKRDIKSVMEAMVQDEISSGSVVLNYEKEFASTFGFRHALSALSWTAAYHLAFMSVGIGQGDEVILSSVAPVAVLDAINQTQAEPIVIDIAKESFHPSRDLIFDKISEKTKAIVFQYPYGSYFNYDDIRVEIQELNRKRDHKIRIIEDISYNVGTEVDGLYIGSQADIAIAGLHEDMLMTIGKGAMVLTNSRNIFGTAKDLRMHASGSPYRLRYDYTITDYQAAMGLEQLGQLSIVSERRKKIGDKYMESIKSVSAISTFFKSHEFDAFGAFPLIFQKPQDYIERYFHSLQIETRRTTPLGTLHEMLGFPGSEFPNAQKLYDRGILLPLYPNLTKMNIERIISSLRGFY